LPRSIIMMNATPALICGRAAIEAICEPTGAMEDAAGECGALQRSLAPGEGLAGFDWTAVWQAMIDTALK
jgi:hypothetical protein